MKKMCLLPLIFISVYSNAQQVQNEKHVVLVSIDGFRPEFYLDSLWNAPTLHRLVKQGVYAEGVKPVYPSVTYPNHISMITGMLPSKHGIYYNRPANGKARVWNTSMIKTPTVFDAVNQAGLSSSALFWPVMNESSIQYNVPLARGNIKGTSSDFMNRIASPGLWKDLEQNAIGKISVNEIRNDKNTGKMAAYILQTYKPALTAVHFIGLDHAQHKVGIKNQTVADALLVIDKAIEQIILAIDIAGMTSNTTLLIVGDHGFCDVHSSLSPNVWLKNKNVFKSSTRWKARFYTSNGAALLYLKDPDDERTLRKVRRLLDNLPDHEKEFFRIIERDELQRIGADPDAMLALNPIPGIIFRQTGSGKLLKQATGGAHGYFADFPDIMTGFIGWGNGLNPGTIIPQMNMTDIAPIITRLLDINFNSEDGVIIEDMFIKY